jgi:hypothetical protein
MKAEKPAEGILKQGSFGAAMFYYVACDCTDPDCSHTIEVEADGIEISVHIYTNSHTKWWEKKRWSQIWHILTRGYAEMQTTIVLREQTALNYAETLKSAMKDVKDFKDMRINPIQPIVTTTPRPTSLSSTTCSECGMVWQGVMGYVCSRSDCPVQFNVTSQISTSTSNFDVESLDPDQRTWYYDGDGTKRRKDE